MTIVRLSDGSLFVHSPVALDDPLKREVDALGPVAHLVAPNLYHHMYFGSWADAYPEAKRHAVPGLQSKRKDLEFHATLSDADDAAWRQDLSSIAIEGCMLGETVFFHHTSRTLITADLVENFGTSDHWWTRFYLKSQGIHQKAGLSRMIRLMFRNKPKARRAIDHVIAWNPERMTLAHGQPILTDAKAAVVSTYQWLSE